MPIAVAVACGGGSTTTTEVAPSGDDGGAPEGGGVDAGGTDGGGGDAAPQSCDVCAMPNVGWAVKRVFLGDTDRNFVANKDAWQAYGANLDGLVSTKTSTDVCTRAAGASPSNAEDGANGVDNNFGKVIVPFLQPFTATPSKSASDAIAAGGTTPLIVYGPPTGFAYAEQTTTAPKWDGTDTRAMTLASTDGTKPLVSFPSAAIATGQLTSGDASGPISFTIGLGSAPLIVAIQKPHVTMTLGPGGVVMNEGIITGYVVTKDFQDAMAKAAGYISPDLCSGATLQSIQQTIAQASDMLKDGTNAAGTPCDAISIGIGFEAASVTVNGVGPAHDPLPDPCN